MTSFVAVLAVTAVSAGQAPSTADYSSYAQDWCLPEVGTPTRSTGECMCRHACDGRGCEAAQGFIWYSYKQCPSCRCTSSKPTEPPVEEDEEPEEEPLEEQFIVDYDLDDRTFSEKVYDFVDDHGHVVLAVFFVGVLLAIFAPLMVTFLILQHKKEPTTTTTEKNPPPSSSKKSD